MRLRASARWRRVLAFAGLALLLVAEPAQAAPLHPAAPPDPAAAALAHHHPPAPANAPTQRAPAPAPAAQSPQPAPPGSAASDLGASGQVDPLAGLGLRNPVCDQLDQIRDRQTRLACETAGSPEGNYPASDYGFDIFITTGITHPVGDLSYGFATMLNGIWLGLIFVLKLIFELLGLAFGLNPFAAGPTMSRITTTIARLYTEVTDPWLSALVVCGGIWLAYKGLVRRQLAAGVAGTLAAIAMLIVGLWVVHQPRESVGRLAGLADEVALGVISAPQSGSVSRPVGSYGEALAGAWARLVEVPFAGLEFSDVGWALGRPPPEAIRIADRGFCSDVGTLALIAELSHLGNQSAEEACAQLARSRYGRPRRLIDVYLRSSPGSPARQALWVYFNSDDRFRAKVAAQGGDGVLTRLSMLALFALGLLGAIGLLAWLAVRLFMQAAIAFVLLLAAPLALFFPLLGDAGRRAFKRWGLGLLGATLAKVIYAALLSIVLIGIAILASSGGATGFLLACAFTWAVFLKRAELVGWISIGEAESHAGRRLAGEVAAFALAGRLSRAGGALIRGVGRRGTERARQRTAEGALATRETARHSLRKRARALADVRYGEAQQTVARFERTYGRQAARGGRGSRPQAGVRGGGRGASGKAPSEDERRSYQRAKALVARVARNEERFGERWSKRDLERFAAEDAELLRGSRGPADHAHRAGLRRDELEALRGPEREQAEAQIEKARKRDRGRLDLSSEPPRRIVGRPRALIERARQYAEGEAGSRREQLKRLRRDPRQRISPNRRNLSRGA